MAGVAVCGVCRRLLVPHINDADAFIKASVVNVDDMPPAKREDGVHPFALQSLGDKVSAGNDLFREAFLGEGVCCCFGDRMHFH